MEENKRNFKYVRTTHGVFYINKEYGDCVMCGTEQEFYNLCKKNFDCFYISTIKQTIYSRRNGIGIALPYIKSADTIEELCDEFVVADRDNHRGRYIVRDDGDLKEVYEKLGDVFGAIWTAKGLLYVAKMNGKGEFELL